MHLLRRSHILRLSAAAEAGYFQFSESVSDWPGTSRRPATWMLPVLFATLVACSGTSSVVGPEETAEQAIASLQVEPSEVELMVGDTTRLSLEGRDSEGVAVPIDNGQVRWSSSDTTVATVNPSGLVRTVSHGETRIEVEFVESGATLRDSANVHSMAPDAGDGSGDDSGGDPAGESSASAVVVTPDHVNLESSEVADLDASVLDSSGAVLDVDVSWTSENPSVVTVDSIGRVAAQASGSTRVLATAGSATGIAEISITPPSTSPDPYDDFRAFPEAEGWGAEALMTCNRSQMQVLHVTNLDDSGAGSLRYAIEQARGDVLTVILFDVAGYIDLQSRIDLRANASCLYLAGQSAPGDGITIRAWDGQGLLFRSGPVTDVVIRYLRFRNGTRNPGTNKHAQGIIVGTGTDIVLDHLSFSWTNGQLFSVYKYPEEWGPLHSLTLQRSLFTESLSAVPTCYSIGGDKTGQVDGIPENYKVQEISFHHNAAIHCSHRAPGVLGVRFADIVNNVVYNWYQGAMHSSRKSHIDYIGNYFKQGPMTIDANYAYEFSHDFRTNTPRNVEPDGYRIIGNTNNIDGRAGPSFYLSDNAGTHNPSGGKANWSMTSKYKNNEDLPESYYSSVEYAQVGLMPISVEGVNLRSTVRHSRAPIPVTIQSAFDAWDELVEQGDVGANQRVACNGDWVAMSDAVDRRVLRDARQGTGLAHINNLASQDDVGGFPSLDAGTTCADSDSDGMPDDFESRYGLGSDDAEDAAQDSDGDGYTNLEEFLNGTAPR